MKTQRAITNGGAPVTLFFDGHIRTLGMGEVIDANSQAVAQGGADESLWHTETPLKALDHYKHDWAYTPPGSATSFSAETSSFHILTRYGILGRDTFSQ